MNRREYFKMYREKSDDYKKYRKGFLEYLNPNDF